MKLKEIRYKYPNAHRFFQRWRDQNIIECEAFETLPERAIALINNGITPEHDALYLLLARTAMVARERRIKK